MKPWIQSLLPIPNLYQKNYFLEIWLFGHYSFPIFPDARPVL
jgi:hypothetical protein